MASTKMMTPLVRTCTKSMTILVMTVTRVKSKVMFLKLRVLRLKKSKANPTNLPRRLNLNSLITLRSMKMKMMMYLENKGWTMFTTPKIRLKNIIFFGVAALWLETTWRTSTASRNEGCDLSKLNISDITKLMTRY